MALIDWTQKVCLPKPIVKLGRLQPAPPLQKTGEIYCVPVPMNGQHPQYLKQWVL